MKFKVLRSYTAVEVYEVEANDENAAMRLIEDNAGDYQFEIFEGDYDRDHDGQIAYCVEESSDG